MNIRHFFQCGMLAALLGVALGSNCHAEDVVNQASFDIEFKYCELREDGHIWSDSWTIPSGYMTSIPNQRQYNLVAIWRRAGTPGDGGWSFPTGLDPNKTGYIGELLLIVFE